MESFSSFMIPSSNNVNIISQRFPYLGQNQSPTSRQKPIIREHCGRLRDEPWFADPYGHDSTGAVDHVTVLLLFGPLIYHQREESWHGAATWGSSAFTLWGNKRHRRQKNDTRDSDIQ